MENNKLDEIKNTSQNYQKLEKLLNITLNMRYEGIIEIHKNLIGKKLSDNNPKDLGILFIERLLNYDYGHNTAKEMPEEYKKFFNSEYFSNYIKQLVVIDKEASSEVLYNAIHSNRSISQFTNDEFHELDIIFGKQNLSDLAILIAFQLDSPGAISFLNEDVNPNLVIKRIIKTSGLSDRPEYYTGRGAYIGDLNGRKLGLIYHKLARLDEKKALSVFHMTFQMPSLGTTEFLITLYRLVANDYNLQNTEICTDNIYHGNDGIGRLLAASNMLKNIKKDNIDDTDKIKTDFTYYIPDDLYYKIFGPGRKRRKN